MRLLAIGTSAGDQLSGVLLQGRPLKNCVGANSVGNHPSHGRSNIQARPVSSPQNKGMALVASSQNKGTVFPYDEDDLPDDSGSSMYYDFSPTVWSNNQVTVDEWFNVDESLPIVNQVYAKISGSPDHDFKRLSTFYPEQHTVEGLFSHRIFTVAMLPCRMDNRVHNYYLLYAESPRHWYRVIVSVTFRANPRVHIYLRAISSENNDWNGKTLPEDFQKRFNPLLAGLRSFSSIMIIKLNLSEIYSPNVPRNVQASEDSDEMGMCDQNEVLEYIEDRAIQSHKESEVLVIWRMAHSFNLIPGEGWVPGVH